ncbi:MAG TPA: molybdopterin-binding protein [Thiolinea sp.]|nr:molybdopterin-binding protein [Thiolinea sp.]
MNGNCSGKVGLILIGDELLNGSRQDKHLGQVLALLKARGMTLAWVRMVGDEPALLTATLEQSFQTPEIVFSFGGIGATPDDLTRQCAARALGVKLWRHPQLVALLEQQFGVEAYPNRIRMAELPDGAVLIPNPVNRIAGFKLLDHHFVPGFPNMAWPMIEWVLDTHYRRFHDPEPAVDWRWLLEAVRESELIPMMEELLLRFGDVRLSSLPSTEKRHQIDFGLKGRRQAVEAASVWFEARMQQGGIRCRRLTPVP